MRTSCPTRIFGPFVLFSCLPNFGPFAPNLGVQLRFFAPLFSHFGGGAVEDEDGGGSVGPAAPPFGVSGIGIAPFGVPFDVVGRPFGWRVAASGVVEKPFCAKEDGGGVGGGGGQKPAALSGEEGANGAAPPAPASASAYERFAGSPSSLPRSGR